MINLVCGLLQIHTDSTPRDKNMNAITLAFDSEEFHQIRLSTDGVDRPLFVPAPLPVFLLQFPLAANGNFIDAGLALAREDCDDP